MRGPSPSCTRYLVEYWSRQMGWRSWRKEKSLITLSLVSGLRLLTISTSGYIWRQCNYNTAQSQQQFDWEHNSPENLTKCRDVRLSVIQMNSSQYRQFLVKIKHEFHQKIKANKVASLPVEQVSRLLYFHTIEEPIILRQFLLKATGKFQISWDDLLQYLEQDISLHEQVQKIEHSPLSATEIVQSNSNQFSKLLHYVKQKETNLIQSITRMPKELAGSNFFLLCMDKEIVFFEESTKTVSNSLSFHYSKMKEKILEKEEVRRVQREKICHQKALEHLDTVEIINIRNGSQREKKTSPLNRFLTSNFKSSVRGSSISSQKSNERAFFRRTESNEAKKKKSNHIRIKNDDVGRVFDIFQQASLKNSIAVAGAFTKARNNFEKNIVLEKQWLQKQKNEKSFGMLSQIHHKNYDSELKNMRKLSTDLNRKRTVLKMKTECSKNRRAGSVPNSVDFFGREEAASKQKNNEQFQIFSNNKHKLEIVCLSACQNFLLVSLFNREIRLLQLKKSLNLVKDITIFEKQFKFVVTHVELYKNKDNTSYRIALVKQKNQKGIGQEMRKSIKVHGLNQDTGVTQFEVYHLDKQKQLGAKVFDYDLDYSVQCQSLHPFGVALFNEKGNFCLIQLRNKVKQTEERVIIDTYLVDPQHKHRISITDVRMHRNQNKFYLSCSSGSLYLLEKLSKKIKYSVKVSSSALLNLLLLKEDTEIMTICKNGDIALYSSLHLQKIYLYQSYHQMLSDSKLLLLNPYNFYVYSARKFTSYILEENEQKLFNNMKPVKILKNRKKLRDKSRTQEKKDKVKLSKIIQGRGGKGDFLALLLQNGQICLIDPELKYIGSYHYLRVQDIVDVVCNQSYQFMAILTDENTIEVTNIYTQLILFTVVLPESEISKKKSSNKNQMLMAHSQTQKLKPSKNKLRENIVLTHIFDANNPECFLAVITQGNIVYHYSEKGNLTLNLNIQKRCGSKLSQAQLIYVEECLVFVVDEELTVLHRQSYYKKSVIRVSNKKIKKVRRYNYKNWKGLICIDQYSRLFRVDVDTQKVEELCSTADLLVDENYHFNNHLLYRLKQTIVKLMTVQTGKEIPIPGDSDNYLYTVLGQFLVKIHKNSSRMFKYNPQSSLFDPIAI